MVVTELSNTHGQLHAVAVTFNFLTPGPTQSRWYQQGSLLRRDTSHGAFYPYPEFRSAGLTCS